MKSLFILFLVTATAVFAQVAPPTTFPGIKTVMTPEDFARAGLSSLTPEQLQLIDTAIISHYNRTVATVANQKATQIAQQQRIADQKQSWLQHFGVPDLGLNDKWRDLPTLKARCTGWVGGNSFQLDNGQVWEGLETIPVELSNRSIEIEPRPGGNFDLIVDGRNTTIRLRRIK